jgi:hypothetical protein
MHGSFDTVISRLAQDEIRRIARLLYGVKQRCGPNAKGSDRWHYRDVAYLLPDPPREAARLIYQKLGPIPEGRSLDRIDPGGPYSIENLRYATAAQQTANRKANERRAECAAIREHAEGPGAIRQPPDDLTVC